MHLNETYSTVQYSIDKYLSDIFGVNKGMKHEGVSMLPPCKFAVKLECSRYGPGVAQRVGRGIALLFHDRGTRWG